MAPVMNYLSIAEMLGDAYGKSWKRFAVIKQISGDLASFAFSVFIIHKIMGQFIAAQHATSYTVIIVLIIISYASFGGISAVAFTDIAQCLIFSLIIPILTWVAFIKMSHSVEHVYTTIWDHIHAHVDLTFCNGDIGYKWSGILGSSMRSVLAYMFAAELVQRIYMASNTIQASKAFYYAFIFAILIGFVSCLMHLFIYANPNYTATLPANGIYSHKAINAFIISLPENIKILYIIALLALIMSNWDSRQHTSTILISHDLIGSFFHHNPTLKMCITKIISYALGVLGMCLGIYMPSLPYFTFHALLAIWVVLDLTLVILA